MPGFAIPPFGSENFKHFSFVINSTPDIMRFAVYPHKHRIEMPVPVRIRPLMHAPFTNIGPNRFHHNRTVSWQISMPRSKRTSLTWRSDSGYGIYIITVRRIILGDELIYQYGFLIW
jgi:hypothetical protein